MNGQLIKLIVGGAPVQDLAAALEKNPDLWKENTWRQDYVVRGERPISPQQDTEAVMFRWAPENKIESVRDSLDVLVHSNAHTIKEFAPHLLACLSFINPEEVGRVFVAKLKSGGFVIPHQDYGMYADHFERFHLVLTSDPGNMFFVQDANGHREEAYMKPGELFWFNHKETHWAVNNSSRPRMHLIIDAVAPNYRRERVTI